MRFALAALFVASTLLIASVGQAINYGDFVGNTVTFEDVTSQNGLFGAPTVSGDSLDFNPNTFEADCSLDPGCPPTPSTIDDTLTLTIQADPGSFIDDILLSEAGDTTISSFLNAFGATQVTATVFIDIFEIDGISVNNINFNTQMTFSNGGAFDTDVDGTGTFIWTGSLLVDLDQIIADNNASGLATRVGINMNNTLIAFAESGATARIEKKDVDGLAITVIPEPGTALLMGLGLAGLAGVRRSSRRTEM